jgi:ABC-type glycerol-3-phosphate transport system substrate-binding protein
MEINIWVQDYGPSIDKYSKAASAYIAKGNDVKFIVQPIAFSQMLPKLLPAIATKTEADIMMGYTNFYVGTDISRLFLRLDEAMGGREKVDEIFIPESLEALDLPEGSVYYMPTGGGLNGCAVTVDKKAWTDAGIDYTTIATWEDLIDAAREMTTFDSGGAMTRAGFSSAGQIWAIDSMIWQMGGNFFDEESGKWSYSSAEGEAALQNYYDLFNGDKPVSSFDLITSETEDMVQGRLASHMQGAYSVGSIEGLYPDFDADGIAMPPLAGATVNQINPAHFGVITLSRRLADNEEKRNHCVGFLLEYFDLDSQLNQLDNYSGSVMDKRVYADPRVSDHKYGDFSKMITDATFSRVRYNHDHVANTDPAQTEFQSAIRGEKSIKDALKAADDYLNDQEQQARERIGM